MIQAAHQSATQEDFNFATDEQDWSAVKLLVDELEQELAERRSNLLFRISVWYMAVRVFRRVEERKLLLRAPSERDLAYHRAVLGFLRGCGELLLLELQRQTESDPRHIGVEFRDFEASVADLRYAERERYGDMKEERRAQILDDVFGAIPSLAAHP